MKEYKLRPDPQDDPPPFGAGGEDAEVQAENRQGAMAADISRALAPDEKTPEDELKALETEVLDEAYLRRYREVALQLKVLETEKERMRQSILRMAGDDAKGTMQVGGALLKLIPRKGKTTVEWEKWGRSLVGEEAVDKLLQVRDAVKDGKMSSAFVTQGKAGVTVEVDIIKI